MINRTTVRRRAVSVALACASLLVGPLAVSSEAGSAALARGAAPAAAALPSDCSVGFFAQEPKTGRAGYFWKSGRTWKFSPTKRLGISGVSSAWIDGPTAWWTTPGKDGGVTHNGQAYEGNIVIDGKGGGVYHYSEEGYALVERMKGPWQDLRVLVGSALSAEKKANGSTDESTRVLYGLTNSGALVRIPITYNSRAVPQFGAQEVVARGFSNVVDLELGWAQLDPQGRATFDHLSGITNSGQFIEVEVPRGKSPKVRTQVLAQKGFENAVTLSVEPCESGRRQAYTVQRKDGSLTTYVDNDYADRSLKGLRAYRLSTNVPKTLRVL